MSNIKNLFFTLLFSIVSIGFVIAQPPPASVSSKSSNPTNITQNKENFVSLDGGFTIALPQQNNSFTGIKATAGVNKGGSQFTWTVPQGSFLVAYVDRILSTQESKQVLQSSAERVIQGLNNEGSKLISKNEIYSNNHPGIEIVILSKSNEFGVLRYILVENRLFILTTGWKDSENGREQLKILDSFRLVDSKAIVAKRIQEVTPESLPQTSIVKKLKTDAEDEGLKGKVKSVTETEEDLAGTRAISGIKMSSEDFYSENGSQVKHIYYDYRGNPSSVQVFGFIDGFKVSKSGSPVIYEYNPPPAAPIALSTVPPKAIIQKPVDTRYSVKYEYKYDDKGRLQEIIRYRNSGEMNGKTVYLYDGNKLDETSYDKEGKITFKTIEVFDDKGNTIEKTYVRQNTKLPYSKYTYTYEKFDDN